MMWIVGLIGGRLGILLKCWGVFLCRKVVVCGGDVVD